MNVLVIDVGGTSAKIWHTAHEDHRAIDSGASFTPESLVQTVRETDWEWEAVALGLPCRVISGRPAENPRNLGPGWVDDDFSADFDAPVRIMNDAAMQALGSYDGGRMLFISLGAAVGSAFIADRLILPLDLGQLPYGNQRLYEALGDEGFDRLGADKWQSIMHDILPVLKTATLADYIVVGG